MDRINIFLKSQGLDDKQKSLYLAGLSLGEANMTELAKKALLKRPTAYLAFKELQEKGLMASVKMRRGLRFIATSPDILMKKTEAQLDELKHILPQLNAMVKSVGARPKIYFYEGKEGYLVAAEESLKEHNTTVRYIGSIDEIHNIFGFDYDLRHYIPTRLKRNIFFKTLLFTSKNVINRDHGKELREIKNLPEKFAFKTSTLIYGDRIAIYSSKEELFTVIIESKEIAHGERQKFDLLWSLIK